MASSRRPEALLDEAIDALLEDHGDARRLLVAYSGGRDSHVLLHRLAKRRPDIPGALVAIHIDHGLHPDSRDWSRHCRRVCDALGIGLTILDVDARPRRGQGPEAAAREARYQALAGCLEAGDCLLTGHHRDDQAETVLLQLLRGSGPAGLAAMPPLGPLGRGRHVRPLLSVDRETIDHYARAEGLVWIDDPGNETRDYARNYLRHEVMPRIAAYWPAVGRTLARSARHCADTLDIVAAQADADWRCCRREHGSLSIPALNGLGPARRRGLIRHWLARAGLSCPAEAHLGQIEQALDRGRCDGQACIDWPGTEVRIWRGRLHARPRRRIAGAPKNVRLDWSPERTPALDLPAGGRLLARRAGAGRGLRWEVAARIEIRFRQGGECLRPAGRSQHRRLKSLLQEAAIPPWHRPGLPLLYQSGELVAIPGIGVAEGFTAGPEEPGLDAVYIVDGIEYRL